LFCFTGSRDYRPACLGGVPSAILNTGRSMLGRMEERDRRAPSGNEDTTRRMDALESGLQNVRSRLDGLERSNRSIESDVRTMRDQINSMQSSIQEMLMIFRNLSDKIRPQAGRNGQQAAGGRQMETAGAGGRVPGAGSKATADKAGGRRERAVGGDELVKDPRHLREDEDEGA